ncbi:MAG TPA: AI-2E family transporter [Nanoarchaeota archaeon]|nr:AI-2E family transporter [Candidatus Pacearchaeota archaeon]HIH18216.1 AI-2E family transporter [Nanoarchaeota archaeon]HIH34331.1 AI-2E family transporter [Nanoarchaeota archaeon]HIH50912.1 AI-2E family transporter [Nanoarchaeota archaeon]HIH65973.1 AI-2E family transporter [Nanoarchaeota archaeon]
MVKRLVRPIILGRYLPTIFFVLFVLLSYLIIKPFIFTLIFAVILAYILSPLHALIQRKIKSSTASAIILIILLAILLSVGGFYFVKTLVHEAKEIFVTFQEAELGTTKVQELLSSPYIKPIVEKTSLAVVEKGTQFLVSLPLFMLNIIIMLFVLFYAFKEKDVGRNVVEMLPLRESYKESLYNEIRKISKLVIYGFVVVGFIQGVVGGLSFFIFGVPNPLFWTLAMIIASILPIGPWLVWIPAAALQFAMGEVAAAVGLAIFGLVVTNNIDLILRPILVGKKAEMHPLIILVGGLGGIITFGAIGLIIGPLILAFTISFIKVYRDEQRKLHLKEEIA